MFKKKKKVKADLGKFVKAKTRDDGEVKGVLIPFRGKQMVENRNGIYDISEVTDVTPTQTLGEDTLNYLQAVRRRHEI
ncbi:hypothetical protein [Dictyobacter aurantiacus]|uniref:Uncharacterized protein n=1 Tax=Dictyobacter aurantiacus TaxID=1936993 RepID=A0A401ZH43_9CHLR|nr:hypothetical protein [Dictyobacter aurantiacus]GCE06162.1 hypothetical protein KDAU_34910 [Dictyobacter aurantiacus]